MRTRTATNSAAGSGQRGEVGRGPRAVPRDGGGPDQHDCGPHDREHRGQGDHPHGRRPALTARPAAHPGSSALPGSRTATATAVSGTATGTGPSGGTRTANVTRTSSASLVTRVAAPAGA